VPYLNTNCLTPKVFAVDSKEDSVELATTFTDKDGTSFTFTKEDIDEYCPLKVCNITFKLFVGSRIKYEFNMTDEQSCGFFNLPFLNALKTPVLTNKLSSKDETVEISFIPKLSDSCLTPLLRVKQRSNYKTFTPTIVETDGTDKTQSETMMSLKLTEEELKYCNIRDCDIDLYFKY